MAVPYKKLNDVLFKTQMKMTLEVLLRENIKSSMDLYKFLANSDLIFVTAVLYFLIQNINYIPFESDRIKFYWDLIAKKRLTEYGKKKLIDYLNIKGYLDFFVLKNCH